MGQNQPMFRNTAHVYDLLYEGARKDYEAEATTLHALVQERAPGAASLLDVACGTGGHLVYLRRWYEVVGVDVDPGMLEVAQRRLPEERFVVGDMRDVHLGRTFDAVCCLFSSVGYMSSAQELNRAVATMVSHCRPGGVFIMDGWVRPEAWRAGPPINLETASDEAVTVARMVRSRRDGDKTFLEMHHLIGSVDGIEHLVDMHELTLFAVEEYVESMRGAGLTGIESIDSPMPDRDRYVGVTPT
jgi:SAM-dependent methyltransferase